jgi:hypothetical protein
VDFTELHGVTTQKIVLIMVITYLLPYLLWEAINVPDGVQKQNCKFCMPEAIQVSTALEKMFR